MRKLGLVLAGLTPFLFGGIQNWAMMKYMDAVMPFKLIGAGFLLLWLCFALALGTDWEKQTVFLLNLPAFVVLLLIFVQEVILSAYWRNAAGMWTQLFFLPLLHTGFALTSWTHSVFPAYAASFALMVCASCLGCLLQRKIRK